MPTPQKYPGGSDEPGIQQRLSTPAHHPLLPPDEQWHQQRGEQPQDPEPAQPAAVDLDHRQQHGDHGGSEQDRPDQVQVQVTPPPAGAGRNHPSGQQ
jgi:hypothetical protein